MIVKDTYFSVPVGWEEDFSPSDNTLLILPIKSVSLREQKVDLSQRKLIGYMYQILAIDWSVPVGLEGNLPSSEATEYDKNLILAMLQVESII